MTVDKRRIDAALKACEGISTQNLEDNVPFLELARRHNVVLRERDALRAAVRHEADCVEACKSEIEALRAKIEAMERQRPVRLVFRSDELDEQIRRATDPAWAEKIEVPRGMVALYALPGAQGEEK